MRTRLVRSLIAGTAVTIAAGGAAWAASREWKARPIIGANERLVPVASTAEARAQFEIEDGKLHFKLKMREPITGLTQAHIHLQAAGTVPGAVNGPVVVFLYLNAAGAAFDGNDTVAKGDLAPSNFIGPLAGKSLDEIAAALDSGRAYVNMHTQRYPGGEIRGQVTVSD